MLRSRFAVSVFVGILAFGAGLTPSATAYEVSPMRQQIDPSTGRNSGVITVTNSRADPLPVEVVVLRREFDEAGEHILVEDDANFIVFPPQALIRPSASQAIRYQYIGDPDLDVAEGYVLDVREVPVELEGFTGFRFVYNFGVAVYVRAPSASSSLSVQGGEVTDEGLVITFMNSGRGFARLTNDRLVVGEGDNRRVLEGEELTGRIDNPVIAPLLPRRIVFRADDLGLPPGPIAVQLREVVD